MLDKNDYINYSTHGICQIEDICFMEFALYPEGRDYYILKPIEQNSARIYVPVDNKKLVSSMRPILSPEEVDTIILSVRNKNLIWIDDHKQRAAKFQDTLVRRDERELLLLVSCLYLRSREQAKGLSSTDMQILKKAESIIEQIFSFSLKIGTKSVDSYIKEKILQQP